MSISSNSLDGTKEMVVGPENVEQRACAKEIRLENNSTRNECFRRFITVIRELHKKIIDNSSYQPVGFFEKLLLRHTRANIANDLVNLEYFFHQMHDRNSEANGPQVYLTAEFIEFAYEFSAKCDKMQSIMDNFRNMVVEHKITTDDGFIDTCFKMVFHLEIPSKTNFYMISLYAGFLKRLRLGMKYTEYIKKRLIELYIVSLFNRFVVHPKSDKKLTTETLTELTSLMSLKINAINGIVFRKIIRAYEINRFMFTYLFLKMNESLFVEMDKYNDAVLFYALLVHYTRKKSKSKAKNDLRRHTIKTMILVELKWDLNDNKQQYFNEKQAILDFESEYKYLIKNISKDNHAFFKPRYTINLSDMLCQVIKTDGSTIYTTKKPNSKPSKDAESRVGISPFSGRINRVNENTTNIKTQKKLDFD